MSKDIHDLLNDEIEAHFNDISQMGTGSTEKSAAINDLAVLYKLRIEENRIQWDADDKDGRRELEEKSKEAENEIKKLQVERDYEIKLKQLEEQIAHREMDKESKETENEIKKLQANNDFDVRNGQLREQIAHRQMEEKAMFDDNTYKNHQIAEQRMDRYVKIGIAGAELTTFVMLYVMGLCYEQYGSFTLTNVKNLLRELRLTKK